MDLRLGHASAPSVYQRHGVMTVVGLGRQFERARVAGGGLVESPQVDQRGAFHCVQTVAAAMVAEGLPAAGQRGFGPALRTQFLGQAAD